MNHKWKLILRGLIVFFGIFGILLNLITSKDHPVFPSLGPLNSFLFFTIQSNLVVVIWFGISLYTTISHKTSVFIKPIYKGATTSYITLTFLVFLIVLEPIYRPTGMHLIASILLHYVVPILVIVDWLLNDVEYTYQYKFVLKWMIYPLVYVAYGLLLALVFNKYLYPFFDIPQLGWWIVPFILILTLVYLGICFTLIKLNNIVAHRKKV